MRASRFIVTACLVAACSGASKSDDDDDDDGGSDSADTDAVRDVFEQQVVDELDIVWVIDNSASMADEQAKLQERASDFIAGIEAAGVDFHIGVITTDLDDLEQAALFVGSPTVITRDTPDYETVFRERLDVGIAGSEQEEGIDAAYSALSEPRRSGPNGGFHREGASLMINYLSDENDCSDRGALFGIDDPDACYDRDDLLVPVAELVEDYRALTDSGPTPLVNAIVGPEITEGCESSKPGQRYWEMVSAFGGTQSSICDDDFATAISQIVAQTSQPRSVFILTQDAIESTIQVWVDDSPIEPSSSDGFTYDDSYRLLQFYGSSVPGFGSTVVAEYQALSAE